MANQENEQKKSVSGESVKELYNFLTEHKFQSLQTEVAKARQSALALFDAVKAKYDSKVSDAKKAEQKRIDDEIKNSPKATVQDVADKLNIPAKAVLDSMRVEKTPEEQPAQPQNNPQKMEYVQNGATKGTYQAGGRFNNQDHPFNKEDRPSYNREDRPFNRESRPYNREDRPPFNRDNRPFNKDGKPPFNRDRPYNSDRPYNAERPSFNREGRPFGDRPFNRESRPFNKDGKPFGDRPFINRNNGTKPPFTNKFNKSNDSVDEFVIPKERERTFGNKKKTHEQPAEKKSINKKQQMRFMLEEDSEDESRMGRRYKVKRKEEKVEQNIINLDHAVVTSDRLTVKDLSEKISKPVAEIVKQLFILGTMATINSTIDFDTAELVAGELGITLEKKISETAEQKLQSTLKQTISKDEKCLVKRPPVVTVMGHVDHGKTSLLDAIRKTNVISGEAGGITQRIGAYQVKVKNEFITFIDTPGHAAFAAMRQRGAQLTDIAILVVAADDGIMPQTKEAIKYIKAAKCPMIVAINKIDREGANIERVKQQLADNDVLPEEWGGDVICVPISAKNGENIDKLLETILLVAEVSELKANPQRTAVGVVIEAELDKGRGPVASVLVQNGTLRVGDTVVSGTAFGRIRAMSDENGNAVKKAAPSTPVTILGLDEVPSAGDILTVVDEKMSKLLIAERKNKIKQDKIENVQAKNLEELFSQFNTSLKTLNVIVKADVKGTAEALSSSIADIKNEEVKVNVVSTSVGALNETDVISAQTSNSIIVCFNIKKDAKSINLAEKLNVEIREYDIIYKVIEDLEDMIKKMQTPKYKERVIGHAEVRVIFKISSIGTVAGSYVLDGKVARNAKARVMRNEKQIAEADIQTLKIQKDDVKEATKGFECGIKLNGFDDFMVGDIIEVFVQDKIEF